MQDNYFTSATVWMIVWLLIGAVITIASSLLTARTLFPEFAGRCAARCATPVRAFFLGLVTVGAGAVLAGIAAKGGAVGQPVAFVVIGCVSLLALAGVSGQIVRMAARTAHDGESANSWAASRRAATILTLSYILPVAGWVVILPLSLLTGLGCAIMSLRVRAAGPAPAAIPVPGMVPPPIPAGAWAVLPSPQSQSVQTS